MTNRTGRFTAALISICLVLGTGLALTPVGAVTKAKVVYHIDTKDKVFFLTIDDGWTMNSRARKYLLDNHIPVSLFHLGNIWADPAHQKFFQPLVDAGADVGNHTYKHSNLKGLSKATQAKAICSGKSAIAKASGVAPTWLRPPYGNYDSRTPYAAATCGVTHLVLWNVSARGSRLSTWGGPMKAGDIVLMHWDDLSTYTIKNVIATAKKQGLTPALLSDYLH